MEIVEDWNGDRSIDGEESQELMKNSFSDNIVENDINEKLDEEDGFEDIEIEL